MKQRKIAISLAVIGAIVAPFVLHIFYKIDYPKWPTWRPLTAAGIQEAKVNIATSCSRAELSDDALADAHSPKAPGVLARHEGPAALPPVHVRRL
jgi:hypothetical protein